MNKIFCYISISLLFFFSQSSSSHKGYYGPGFKISDQEILDLISSATTGGIITATEDMATQEWVAAQGYATTADVTTATADMATQEWVTDQGYATTADVTTATADMATQEWVAAQGFATTDDADEFVKHNYQNSIIDFSNSNLSSYFLVGDNNEITNENDNNIVIVGGQANNFKTVDSSSIYFLTNNNIYSCTGNNVNIFSQNHTDGVVDYIPFSGSNIVTVSGASVLTFPYEGEERILAESELVLYPNKLYCISDVSSFDIQKNNTQLTFKNAQGGTYNIGDINANIPFSQDASIYLDNRIVFNDDNKGENVIFTVDSDIGYSFLKGILQETNIESESSTILNTHGVLRSGYLYTITGGGSFTPSTKQKLIGKSVGTFSISGETSSVPIDLPDIFQFDTEIDFMLNKFVNYSIVEGSISSGGANLPSQGVMSFFAIYKATAGTKLMSPNSGAKIQFITTGGDYSIPEMNYYNNSIIPLSGTLNFDSEEINKFSVDQTTIISNVTEEALSVVPQPVSNNIILSADDTTIPMSLKNSLYGAGRDILFKGKNSINLFIEGSTFNTDNGVRSVILSSGYYNTINSQGTGEYSSCNSTINSSGIYNIINNNGIGALSSCNNLIHSAGFQNVVNNNGQSQISSCNNLIHSAGFQNVVNNNGQYPTSSCNNYIICSGYLNSLNNDNSGVVIISGGNFYTCTVPQMPYGGIYLNAGNSGMIVINPDSIPNYSGAPGMRDLIIDANGVVYKATGGISSKRYKDCIENIYGEDEVLDYLQVVSFKYKGYDEKYIGLIAEDLVQTPFEFAVIYDEQGRPEGINYTSIFCYLLAAYKEKSKKDSDTLKKQEERITMLENKIEHLLLNSN